MEIIDILLVEDDLVDRKAIIRALRPAPYTYHITEAATGGDALDYLRCRPFDCVLLDFHLPDITGLEVLRHVRQEKIDIPIVMLTGQQDAKAVAELMKAGAADYIAKDSLPQSNLFQIIKNVVRIHRAEKEAAGAVIELRRTAVKLARAQGIARIGDWEWDILNQQMSWSHELYELFGVPLENREKPVETLFGAVLHPDDYETALIADGQTRLGHPTDVEYRICLPDGRIYYMHSWSEAVTDQSGQINAIAGVVQDITERKEAEIALQEQKELFEKLVTVARATIESPTLDQTLRGALKVSLEITGADSGVIFLLKNDEPVAIEFVNLPWPLTAVGAKALAAECLQNGLEGRVVRERQVALIGDTSQDSRWSNIPGPYTGSALSVPIVQGTAVVGVVTLLHPQPNHFTPQTAALMAAAVDQMTLAMSKAQIFDIQRNMARRQTTLYETLRAISGQTSIDAVAQLATNTITRFTGWSNAFVALHSPEKDEWRILAPYGEMVSKVTGLALPTNRGIISRAFHTGDMQYVPDISLDPDYVVGVSSTRSELAIPLYRRDEIFAVLDIQDDATNAFTPDDLSLAHSLADLLTLSLESARLFQTIQEERGRLQAIIQSSRDGLIMVGANQRILVINEPALRLLDLPGTPAAWIGNDVLRVLSSLRHTSPETARTIIAQYRLRKTEKADSEGEIQIKLRTIRWQDLPVKSSETLLGRLFVLHDVTKARSLETLRTDMTRAMVHDLRNPLMGISSSIELVREMNDNFPPLTIKMLSTAEQSSQQMLRLVNAILDISELESGQMPFAPQSFSLTDLISDECVMQTPLAIKKAIQLTHSLPSDLPSVWGDPELIQRTLQNLIDNALKFTPRGGEVEVTAVQTVRSGKPALRVEIQDNGPGIPLEIEEQLFTKFTTGSQAEAGNGLGLAYCKSALAMHGQQIWVTNRPAGGTVFTFTLAVADST